MTAQSVQPHRSISSRRGTGRLPAVGAVVVNFNGSDRVLRVIEALARQSHVLAEIIVVDNASVDGSPRSIRERFPAVRILELGSNTGLSNARNVGLRELTSALALLIDHDIYPDQQCVELMVRACEATAAAVVCPRIRLLPESDIIQVEGAEPHFLGTLILRHGYQRLDRTPPSPGYVMGCPGGCMLVRRREILDAGGFDELFFFYLEDLEFSLRLRAVGHRFWCEPAAEVFHEPAAGTPGLSFRGHDRYPAQRAYYTMRNRLLTILIHYRLRTLLVLAPALALYELAALTAACSRRLPIEWFRAWWWQLRHVPMILTRRRRMQERRVLDDRYLLVGGAAPVAPGLLTSPVARALHRGFSFVVNGYWSLARRWIG